MFGRKRRLEQEKVIEVLEKEIKRLQEHNNQLFDKLMARSYPELQTYTPPVVFKQSGEAIKWNEDENLAGEEIDEEEARADYENR